MPDTKQQESTQQKNGKIPISVWQIGFMMMLMNISFVMVYSFSGLYLKHILGASVVGIGVLEGFCETLSHTMKLVSGMLSDFFKKRKKIMMVGYAFSVVSKPLIAISSSFAAVFSARMMERLGNGIQASPRDAIVADVAPKKKIGASYGLKRTLAYAGSLLGGVFGIIFMDLTNNNYQMVFAIASIPAVFAFLILLFLIKEPQRYEHPAITSQTPMPKPKTKQKFLLHNFKYLGKPFWILMIVNFIFMIARMNETFLILYANEGFGVIAKFAPIIMIIYNLGTSIASYPIGIIGDKFNRTKILFVGVVLIVMSDIVLFSSSTLTVMGIGILLWGLQFGTTQNIFVSLIAERVPEDLRGTGFGIYWLVNAIASFIADTLAGFVAHRFSLSHIFVSSGIIALASLTILALFMHTLSPRVKMYKS
ncbi:MAG: MFS transporter [Holosporales bacterium]|jgi:MFS family permease|nr:MFS transporter [Holosporales bacterium]